MVHGFFQLPSLFDDGRAAVEGAGAALREAFGLEGAKRR
jgi:hypothetical protein